MKPIFKVDNFFIITIIILPIREMSKMTNFLKYSFVVSTTSVLSYKLLLNRQKK